jgi:hypothetical protein
MSSHPESRDTAGALHARPTAGSWHLTALARHIGRVDLILGAVFVLSTAFYLWTAGTSVPLSLHDGSSDRYNLLATALLHLELSVGRAPAALMRLADPYNPKLNGAAISGPTDGSSLNDDVLYHGQLYFVWGATPALLLLVPLHLLGLEPSASVTVAVYSIAGLGFLLAALRVLINRLAPLPAWMYALAALTLSLCSAIAFISRTPGVTEDVLAGGYCFSMAGIWLVLAALADRRASTIRLVLMSLCFGLAAGARPALGLSAIALIPVYLCLRPSRSRRSLVLSLGVPIGVCFVLLLAYNQARFHQPFEIGSRYQLTGYDSRVAPLGHIGYVLPGVWLYLSTLPRFMIVFPFIALGLPAVASPNGLGAPEITGGLFAMAPIVVFVAALPWMWRRRPAVLGGLAPALILLAGAGVAMMFLDAYEFFASTERYEVDFATLFVLGGVAGWMALASGPPGRRRRLLRAGGGLLAAWGCVAGFAISFFGYGNALAKEHPGTWRTLEDIGSPLSTAAAVIAGRPEIAASFASVSAKGGVTEFVLTSFEQAHVTIVSPSARAATLRATVELRPGFRYALGIEGPGHVGASYAVPASGGVVGMPVQLKRGLNYVALHPAPLPVTGPPPNGPVMRLSNLAIAARP